MKKSILFLSTIFIVLTVLFSCSDDETDNNVEETTKELKLASQEVSLMVGEKKTIKIVTGNDSYTVTASNAKIKTSTEKGIITIEGVASGDAVVTVTDSKKKVAKIKVVIKKTEATIADLTLDITNLDLVKGNKGKIAITGGSGTYTVKSDKTSITVELKGTSIEVMANEIGTAKVTVTDTESKKTKEVTVVVNHVMMLELDKTDLTVLNGAKGTVTITGGSGTYTVESNDTATATVGITGNEIEITGEKVGTTKVIVTDTNSNKTKEITIKVVAIAIKYLKGGLELAPDKIDKDGPYFNVSVGDIITIQITGGTGVLSIIGVQGSQKLEFLELTSVLGGKKNIQNNSFRVKIIAKIVNTSTTYFQIKDAGGATSEYISFEPK